MRNMPAILDGAKFRVRQSVHDEPVIIKWHSLVVRAPKEQGRFLVFSDGPEGLKEGL